MLLSAPMVGSSMNRVGYRPTGRRATSVDLSVSGVTRPRLGRTIASGPEPTLKLVLQFGERRERASGTARDRHMSQEPCRGVAAFGLEAARPVNPRGALTGPGVGTR